jgi:hypothetical protein
MRNVFAVRLIGPDQYQPSEDELSDVTARIQQVRILHLQSGLPLGALSEG